MPSAIRELPAAECQDRLRHHGRVGRLGFIDDGKPVILPVNYVTEDESIVFCTAPGTKLGALGNGAEVVFEIDESRPLYRAGWSVLARGIAREVTDPDHLARLRSGPLKSWAVSPGAHWVQITLSSISGREIEED